MVIDDAGETWPLRPLGEVAKISSGGAFPIEHQRKQDGEFPFFKVGDMNRNGNEREMKVHEHSVTEAIRRILKAKAFPPGSIIFPKIGAAIATNKKRILTRPSCVDNNVMAVIPGVQLDPYYLLLLFLNKDLLDFANDSTPPSMRKGEVEQWEIPVPPLAEQQRIVARVEALSRRIDQARQVRHAALAEAETVEQSAVDSAFSERSSAWETETLEALCGKPQYGYTESASAAPIGPRFVRITDIQGGRVNWETVPYCECDDLDKYRLQTGDILFARTGATTGKSYLVKDPPEAVFASYLIRVRRGERILPEFLWWYFQSSNYWQAVFSGTEDGNRPNMNGSKLAGLEVPFPNSLEMQKQIIKRLDAVRFKLSELQQLQSETEAELASFTPALLAKAFRGEL